MVVTISEIDLISIKQPLKQPFKTSLQRVEEREVILVKVQSSEGLAGYGECVAFSTPWYTEETVASCRFVMENVLIPLLKGKVVERPEEIHPLFSRVKGNRMAKAAIEMAVWDLFAKKKELPLWQMVGGTREAIPAGVVVAADETEISEQVEAVIEKGYSRVKIKITPTTNIELLTGIVSRNPDTLFFADANGAFDEQSFEQLKRFDQIGLTLIEQPFGEQEWHLHARAKREMKTPICLDESITCLEDVERMIDEQAGDIIVLKMARLGGWSETLRIVELCRQHSVGMWVGGMIEFGVSKAHNLALAALPGISLPGDFSDSDHFWRQDIIEPEIKVRNGKIALSEKPGIGYAVRY